jgi:ligand-binding SRPBCC domain-containing protein
MKIFKLSKQQRVNASMEKVWDFFSSPENLDEITPDNMGFKIITPKPLPKMYEGQVIEYKVAPLLGIPLYWKTLITEVKDGAYFIDEQVKGPYKLWRHKHIFEDKGDYVLMKDELDYALPLGFLGTIAKHLFVGARIEEIFAYRFDKVEEIFNNSSK